LNFYVKELKTANLYGPYATPAAVVSLHLFGKYDGLLGFLTESFVFDDDTGSYRFVDGGFSYSKGVYDFTESVATVARRISEKVAEMHTLFEYEFEPRTYYAESAVEVFLNTLNGLFNENNFTQYFKDTDEFFIGRVNRSSGIGCRTSNGRGFFALNFSERRHGVFFGIRRAPVDYIRFVSAGTQSAEDVMLKFVTQAPETEITNMADAGRYIEQYSMIEDVHSVIVKDYAIFNDILAIIFPTDQARFSIALFKDEELGVFAMVFDAFSGLYTIYGEDDIDSLSDRYSRVSFRVDSGRLIVTSDSGFVPSDMPADVVINAGGIEGYVDCSKNRMLTKEGNVMSINYATSLLAYAL